MRRLDWILLSDVDGTLDYRCTGIDEKVIQSAGDYVNTGGGLALATGRAIVSTQNIAQDMRINTASILFGGAMLYDYEKKAVQWMCPLRKDIISVVKEIICKYTDVAMLVYTDKGIFILNSNELLWKKGIPKECDPRNEDKNIKGNILKLSLVGEPERLEQIRKDFFMDTEFNFSYASQHFVEIVSEKAGKGKAMQVLSDMLNIPLKRFIAMGDGQNDLDMLSRAGTAFTLENAADNLKEISDIILPHCKKQGAAEGFAIAGKIVKNKKKL